MVYFHFFLHILLGGSLVTPIPGWAAQPPGPEEHLFFSLPCPHPHFLYIATEFSSQLRWAVTIVEAVGCNGCNQDVEQNFTALGMVHVGSKIMSSGPRRLKICIKRKQIRQGVIWKGPWQCHFHAPKMKKLPVEPYHCKAPNVLNFKYSSLYTPQSTKDIMLFPVRNVGVEFINTDIKVAGFILISSACCCS